MTRSQDVATMLVFPMMLLPGLSFAGEVNLPKTGQETCYDEIGDVIECTDTGQDGDIQAGVEWPTPRFEDNGDGTVTDHLTGLIWLKDADCFGKKTWSDALSDCNNLASGSCGLTDGSVAGDWRLPNVVELESLVNSGASDPDVWLEVQGFSDVRALPYWAATTSKNNTDIAWYVELSYGRVANDYFKWSSYYFWPVRGGETGPSRTWKTGQTVSYATGDDGDLQRGVTWPSPRFEDNGDGTVTDRLTGLMWLKNADCFGSRTWSQALTDCNNLASGSCGLTDGSVAGDWRLPNRKELFSLADYSRYNPVVPQGHPFGNVQVSSYWSATTQAYDTDVAWYVTMLSGQVYYSLKSSSLYVWPVRQGEGGPVEDIPTLGQSGRTILAFLVLTVGLFVIRWPWTQEQEPNQT